MPTNECSFCSSQQRETFNHFKRICPRFHDARVAAHNKICECLSEARRNCGRKVLPKGWVLYEEPVFYSHCKITVLDIIRPSDIWREWLQSAHQDKLRTYEPLRQHCRAISNYADSNWEIRILPWVVGTRWLVLQCAQASALEFLELPRGSWQLVIESTVQAAVTALIFMHRASFSRTG